VDDIAKIEDVYLYTLATTSLFPLQLTPHKHALKKHKQLLSSLHIHDEDA